MAKITPYNPKSTIITGASQGINLKDLPQLLNIQEAEVLSNYIPLGAGKMVKRKGSTTLHSIGSENATMYVIGVLENTLIVGYGTTVGYINISTGIYTELKDDFASGGRFYGDSNRDYFYITNGTGVWEISHPEGSEIITMTPTTTETAVSNGTYQDWAVDDKVCLKPSTSLIYAAGITAGKQYKLEIATNYTSFIAGSGNTYSKCEISGATDIRLAASGATQTFYFNASNNGVLDITFSGVIGRTSVANETPTGTIDGVNKEFRTANHLSYQDIGSLFVDGVQVISGVEWDGRDLIVPTAPTTSIEIQNFDKSEVPFEITSFSVVEILEDELQIEKFSEERGSILKIINNRLYLADYPEDETKVVYSDTGLADNPPTANFAVVTTADGGGEFTSNHGKVQAMETIGNQLKVFYANGQVGHRIKLQSDGSKRDVFDYNHASSGATSGTCQTPYGLIVSTVDGVFISTAGAASDIPYSDHQNSISRKLGTFKDYDFTGSASVYYPKYDMVLISCRKDSDANNSILCYYFQQQAWGTFSGLNVSSFVLKDGKLYAGDELGAIVYELFSGNNDSGKNIFTKYRQELNVGDFSSRKDLTKQWFDGLFSSGTVVDVAFNTYNYDNTLIVDKLNLVWSTDSDGIGIVGIGSGEIGDTIGGDSADYSSDLASAFAGGSGTIKNFRRLIIEMSESSQLPHEINLIKIETRVKSNIRERSLSTTSLPGSNALITEDSIGFITEDKTTIITE